MLQATSAPFGAVHVMLLSGRCAPQPRFRAQTCSPFGCFKQALPAFAPAVQSPRLGPARPESLAPSAPAPCQLQQFVRRVFALLIAFLKH